MQSESWQPSASISTLKKRSLILQKIRQFFVERDVLEVDTPALGHATVTDQHLHSFETQLNHPSKPVASTLYLQTSPEFAMKKLLSSGLEKIYQICWCFRDEPSSLLHRPQFLMLEWYRRDARYEDVMQDIEELISELSEEKIKIERKTINQIFKEILGFEILNYLDKKSLHQYIKGNLSHLPLHEEFKDWDDYFFLIFLNEIEPKLINYYSLHPARVFYKFSIDNFQQILEIRIGGRQFLYLNIFDRQV
jgi:lysyl-tRNA synthetase class 2